MIRIGVSCLLGFLIIDITVVGGELTDPARVLSCRRWWRLRVSVSECEGLAKIVAQEGKAGEGRGGQGRAALALHGATLSRLP